MRLRRLRCVKCGTFHRALPEVLFPYKQYEAEVIRGVLEGLITCETIDFEDYPCEMTMERWKAQKEQLLLDAGFSVNFLDPVFCCPDCQDTGYIGREKSHCFRQA